MKYSTENLSNFFICLSSISFCSSFSTFSIKGSGTLLLSCCVGWNVWWNVDLATWFFDFPILVHKLGYFWNIHGAMLFCVECKPCIFSPGFVNASWAPSFVVCPALVGWLCLETTNIWQLFASVLSDFRSSCIVWSTLILIMLKHLNSPIFASVIIILFPNFFCKDFCRLSGYESIL